MGDKLGPRQKGTEDGALSVLANHPHPRRCNLGMYMGLGNMHKALLNDPPQPSAPPYFRPLSLETSPKGFISWLGQEAESRIHGHRGSDPVTRGTWAPVSPWYHL